VDTFHGKSMRPGGGGRFAAGQAALERKGYSEKSAGAIMAVRGRKAYGKEQMAKWSAAGRKRAAKKGRFGTFASGKPFGKG
jgi:hypothetical protein